MIDYTTVIGVDAKHLRQLAFTWPTWVRHKPSILKHPLLIFYDKTQVTPEQILKVVTHPQGRLVSWPPQDVVYEGGNDKWTNPQRYKMLAGFVYASALVATPYWLKLDTDTVAVGCDDWIDQEWFMNSPDIVAQSWGFTKPADQMVRLDEWASSRNFFTTQPLNLAPTTPHDTRISHKRIISWCGFFKTSLSQFCVDSATLTSGFGKLPVPSQDGFMWYCARRRGNEIRRVDMKCRGWEHWGTDFNVRQAAERSMCLATFAGV